MTIINISVRVPSPDGVLVPAKGQLRWTPTRRRDVDGTVILPHPFTVNLVDGDASVDVEPSTSEWAWMVDEYFLGVSARTVHVAVPAVGPVAYTALTLLDPATLDPAAVPEAAWWAVADSTVTTGTVVGDDLILTRTDGTEVNAGNVRGLPGVDGADGTSGADGAPGPAGADGDSAYQIAVTNGFVGTEAEWLASLEGADGAPGPAGDKGDTGNASIYELRGTGMPNGVVTANPGTYYTDTAGTNGAWRWLKASGTGTTGWVVNYGDTGWRSLPINAAAIGVGSKVLIRRVGPLTSFVVSDLTVALSDSITTILADNNGVLPTGFSAPSRIYLPVLAANAFEGTVDLQYAQPQSTPKLRNRTRKDYLSATGEWNTPDAWPTTLPGTAA